MNFQTSLKLLPAVVATLNLMTAVSMPSHAAQDLTNRSEESISQVVNDQIRNDSVNFLEDESSNPLSSTSVQISNSSDLMSESWAIADHETVVATVDLISDLTVSSQSQNHTFTIKNTEEIVELNEPSFTAGGLAMFLLSAPLALALTKPKRPSLP